MIPRIWDVRYYLIRFFLTLCISSVSFMGLHAVTDFLEHVSDTLVVSRVHRLCCVIFATFDQSPLKYVLGRSLAMTPNLMAFSTPLGHLELPQPGSCCPLAMLLAPPLSVLARTSCKCSVPLGPSRLRYGRLLPAAAVLPRLPSCCHSQAHGKSTSAILRHLSMPQPAVARMRDVYDTSAFRHLRYSFRRLPHALQFPKNAVSRRNATPRNLPACLN